MLSIRRLAPSFLDTHLHTSKMTCIGLVVISRASLFSRLSMDREALSRLLLVDWNVESTSSDEGGLRWFVKE